MEHYKTIEATLQSTLLMAQSTAEEVKEVANKQAEQILNEAKANAKKVLEKLKNVKIKGNKINIEKANKKNK